ncbi:PEP-CTERM sorting domain-containing protein [Spiribacter vilamensis]|uniref:Putative secreted protein with PEP-CTERM sorting signal n=1 Tax=Spiribacter vilamensis TaxID=531306 RepID=A0A4Q8CZC4_9GAMM|nr:PEP-CTERM sorting domain-containing protein [Spiribacter vilamensis]RZU98376.1 putative secreted protein with PEP-CTERM sorting signal [Spiribacter vilamensis]
MTIINRRKKSLTALATVALMAAAGGAHASFILSFADQSRPFDETLQDGPVAGEFNGAAFDAEADFFARLDSRTTETFESFDDNRPLSPVTSVGSFLPGPLANNGTGTNCVSGCTEPVVLNQADVDGNTGRYDVTGPNGQYYLDSNDLTQVRWELGTADPALDSSYNAIGFYLMDPSDQKATFEISTLAGTELFTIPEMMSGTRKDGDLIYLSAISTAGAITSASILFTNTDGNTSDGFGLDNVTVGVPAPGMLAMLGSGLMALGLFGRRRKDRLAA